MDHLVEILKKSSTVIAIAAMTFGVLASGLSALLISRKKSSVTITLLGGLVSGLSVLTSRLLRSRKKSSGVKIILTRPSGRTIEVPEDTTEEDIQKVLSLFREYVGNTSARPPANARESTEDAK
jgi:hypothetical protein